ncbi:hypothetical protein [Pandoraea bronchicola]|uniref:Uncharacterized protein n=1 Tax=Pandoraea bronchicola TaxID=2508287 RepID=A0A5E5BYY5_9BURK|nr:hypothetical protein [Pandoraea bronchicola]VVE90698.1 hypothetical protein PBR20603_04685 [Pandoraea bronchicola]
MIDATAGREDVMSSTTSGRKPGDGAVDPAWRGVWQSAMERTQAQSWFHAAPDAGPSQQDGGEVSPRGDDDARSLTHEATSAMSTEHVSRSPAAKPQAVSMLPTSAYLDVRSAMVPEKASFSDTAYAVQSSSQTSLPTAGGAREGVTSSPDAQAYPATAVQAIVREAFDSRDVPVRWHVSFSDGGVNVWLGVAATHADVAQALVPALRDAMRREGISVRTMTLNGVVVQAQDDVSQVAAASRNAPSR